MREGDKKIDFVHLAGSSVLMNSKNLSIICQSILFISLSLSIDHAHLFLSTVSACLSIYLMYMAVPGPS